MRLREILFSCELWHNLHLFHYSCQQLLLIHFSTPFLLLPLSKEEQAKVLSTLPLSKKQQAVGYINFTFKRAARIKEKQFENYLHNREPKFREKILLGSHKGSGSSSRRKIHALMAGKWVFSFSEARTRSAEPNIHKSPLKGGMQTVV